MRSSAKTTVDWTVSRRTFLKKTGATVGALGLAPAVCAPFVSRARRHQDAENPPMEPLRSRVRHLDRRLRQGLGQEERHRRDRRSYPPSRDCRRGPPRKSRPRRATICSASTAPADPHLYIKHTARSQPARRRDGEEVRQGRADRATDRLRPRRPSTWSAFPDYFIRFPGLYRKDLWDEIGMTPDTWEDVRKGGAKLKAKGNPVGIGLGHCSRPQQQLARHAVVVWRLRCATRPARRSRSIPRRRSRS